MKRQTVLAVGVAGAVGFGFLIWTNGAARSTAATILKTIPLLVPSKWGTTAFDWMLGGKLAPGKYRYYEAGHGTTCAIVVNAVLEKAGLPAHALNRGARFRVGQHVQDLLSYAKSRGAFAEGGVGMSPGDIYYIDEPGNPSNWHMGFVWRQYPGGVETADGGQSDENGNQCARFVRRRQRSAGKTVELSGPAGESFRRVRWHIKAEKL